MIITLKLAIKIARGNLIDTLDINIGKVFEKMVVIVLSRGLHEVLTIIVNPYYIILFLFSEKKPMYNINI